MSIITDDNKLPKRVDINQKNPNTKAEKIDYDRNFENSIRPKSFDTYIGQSALKETLKITIEAAKSERNPLTTCFFTGLRGLVKQLLQA